MKEGNKWLTLPSTHLHALHPSVELSVTLVVVFHGVQLGDGGEERDVRQGDAIAAEVLDPADLQEMVEVVQARLQQVLLLWVQREALVDLRALQKEV